MSYSPGMAINNTNVLQMHKFHSRLREGKPNPLYADDDGRATVRSISAAPIHSLELAIDRRQNVLQNLA